MDYSSEMAVGRAIRIMHGSLSEPVTIDDMARAAMFSKFHFARLFQRATGVSPGRFLSAIRLQHAKRLLLETQLYVSDISLQAGYNSVGTFSSRFSQNVGISPTMFRRLDGFAPAISTSTAPGRGSVLGEIIAPPAPPGLVFAGLFPGRLPAGRPVSCTILDGPVPFVLDAVPDGEWFLLAHHVATTDLAEAASRPFTPACLTVGVAGPIVIRGGGTVRTTLRLRPATVLDPPVLMALLDARRAARAVVAARAA